MEAGRELDALVAEKVMGITVTDWPTGRSFSITSAIAAGVLSDYQQSKVPHYSTDITAAWEVVDHIVAQRGCIPLITLENDYNPPEWYVEFQHTGGFGTSPSVCVAICLAALKALDLP